MEVTVELAKVRVGVFLFCYGGNGGIASTSPDLAFWFADLQRKIKADPRISEMHRQVISDTPITMSRNLAVRIAKESGCDMFLMLDSDNIPDAYLNSDKTATPFWETAFDFAYKRLTESKIPTVIAAPYCGPPPSPVQRPGVTDHGEVPYLFEWMNNESDTDHPAYELKLLTRNEAAKLRGVYPVAALPTGVCLCTTNAFEYPPPPQKGYFHYEFNEDASEKMSTEDVVATRDLSLYWKMKHNVDVLWATCDSWALHVKTKKVGRPRPTPVEAIAKDFRDSITTNYSGLEQKRYLDLPLPPEVQQRFPFHEEVEEDSDLDVEEPTEISDYEIPVHQQNGKLLAYRLIGGRKVATYEDALADETIEAIASLAGWVARHKGGPIEVAVLHSGTGQVAAALLDGLPDGSHVHCLDSLLVKPNGANRAGRFYEAFSEDMAMGRVTADIEGRDLPKFESSQHLDLIFFVENYANLGAEWVRHLVPGGVIAGLDDTELAVYSAKESNLHCKISGPLWAIPTNIKLKEEPANGS